MSDELERAALRRIMASGRSREVALTLLGLTEDTAHAKAQVGVIVRELWRDLPGPLRRRWPLPRLGDVVERAYVDVPPSYDALKNAALTAQATANEKAATFARCVAVIRNSDSTRAEHDESVRVLKDMEKAP